MKTLIKLRSLIVLIGLGVLFAGCPEVIMDDDMPPPEGPIELCSLEEYRVGDVYTIPDRGELTDYILTCNISLHENVVLRIMPGVTIEVENGLYIAATGQAAFDFNSFSTAPIIFRGGNGVHPSWKGIYLETTNPTSIFYNVVIENAGTEALGFSSPTPPGALIVENSRVTIQNCEFRYNSDHAVVLYNAELGSFDNNYFTNNFNCYPIGLTPSVLDEVGPYLSSCEFGSYAVSYHYFRILDASPYIRDAEIYAAPIPYLSNSTIHADGEGVTIHAGTHIVFEAGKGLVVGGDESSFLSIEGTPENPVVLEGEFDLAESWAGILIDSDSPFSRINNVVIRNASRGDSHKSAIQIGQLGPGRCIVENTTIENSECGIYLRLVDEITTDNLTFVGVDNEFCND